VLFREGEPGKEMFVLQSGKIAISKKVRDVEKVLAVLGPGEFFGEMAIISNKPRNASAIVEEDAKLLVIDPRTFEGMIRGSFTGKKLETYFSPAADDWVNARRIINGLDKANAIAAYGKSYYAAISHTT